MAANKFATMLHRSTNKTAVILVYAVLEWILIFLLLLNSFFSYLITKFANYFGLKPPCVWCSRVDHILEPSGETNSYRDLVCDKHASEISRLSFCSNHQKLAESHLMCDGCLASRPIHSDNSMGITRRIAFISWVSTDKFENGEKLLSCSCCDESLNRKMCPPFLLIKPSWSTCTFDYTQKEGLITEALEDGCKEADSHSKEPSSPSEEDNNNNDNEDEHQMLSDPESLSAIEESGEECGRSVSNSQCHEKEAYEDITTGSIDITELHSGVSSFTHRSADDIDDNHCCFGGDDLLEIMNLCPQQCDSDRLIPVELIDLLTTTNRGSYSSEKHDLRNHHHQSETIDSSLQTVAEADVYQEAVIHQNDDIVEKTNLGETECLETAADTENPLVQNCNNRRQDTVDEASEQDTNMQAAVDVIYREASTMKELVDPPAHQEEKNGSELLVEQSKPKTLMTTEESDHHASTLHETEEPVPPLSCLQEDRSFMIGNGAENVDSHKSDTIKFDLGLNQVEINTKENKVISVDMSQEETNNHLSMHLDLNEAEEEKLPDTPTSVESLHYLHKKLLFFKKSESGTEESLDGSVASEMESSDPVQTIERLKTALKSERKTMSALYAELEEERNASAVAANQTMAMITRLQEEKAAMQMEALQYQRMMEEQSEYDQEALQLLNDLMVKRENEKQELEKELEIYRKKVLDCEAKEKIRTRRRSKDRKSSSSCSNMEDSDDLSIDLNREARDEDTSSYGHQESIGDNTPADAVLNLEEMALDCVKHISALDESLTEYEEERLSILDQIKALEEKLITLGDDEFIEDVKSIQHSLEYEANGFEHCEFVSTEENGVSDCFSKDNYGERKTMASLAKSLLPLLNAAENESDEELICEKQVESESVEVEDSSVSRLDLDSKKLDIIEEVDHVYGRLQALEEDEEFLKHCMGSIKQGDKGMDLLQEILQHLRDLKAVELRTRSLSDDPLR